MLEVTGITRAKKILVLVGTKKALGYAVRNVTVSKRNTMLKERAYADTNQAGSDTVVLRSKMYLLSVAACA